MTRPELDGEYTATLDRIVSELGVLLIEEDGDTIDERTVDEDELPEGGDEEGAVLTATFADDELVALEPEPEKTEERRETARERFERLSERPPKKEDADDAEGTNDTTATGGA
ncbi:hypothetical protein JCM17823_13740 [Halorubrum gandharaense]